MNELLTKMTRPLNKREQKKLMLKATEVKNKRKYTLFFIGFFLSLVLLFYSYIQYRWTIIDYKIPLGIFMISSLLLGGFIKKYFGVVLKQNMAKVYLFWFFVMAGGYVTSLFFFLNNILSKNDVYSIKASIVESYKTRDSKGREGMHVEVKLFDLTKDLSFSIEDEEKVNASNFVVLGVSKGGLGFEVIRDRTPIK